VVIHGVQHVFHPPASSTPGPKANDRKSRVVFITRGHRESTIRKVFASFSKPRRRAGASRSSSSRIDSADRGPPARS